MRAGFDDLEFGRAVFYLREPLRELKREQFTEQIAHADARKKISIAPDVRFLFIISINGTIERQLHEAGEGNRPVFSDLARNYFKQRIQVWQCGADLANTRQVATNFYG